MARQSNQAVAKLDHQRKKTLPAWISGNLSIPKKIAWFTGKNDLIHGLPEDLAPDTAIASMPHTNASGTMGRFRFAMSQRNATEDEGVFNELVCFCNILLIRFRIAQPSKVKSTTSLAALASPIKHIPILQHCTNFAAN